MGSATYAGLSGYITPLTSWQYRGPSTVSGAGGTGSNFTRLGTYFGWALTSQSIGAWYTSNMPGNGILATNPPRQMLIPLRWGLCRGGMLVTGPVGS